MSYRQPYRVSCQDWSWECDGGGGGGRARRGEENNDWRLLAVPV